jgi:hypothetical protein
MDGGSVSPAVSRYSYQLQLLLSIVKTVVVGSERIKIKLTVIRMRYLICCKKIVVPGPG